MSGDEHDVIAPPCTKTHPIHRRTTMRNPALFVLIAALAASACSGDKPPSTQATDAAPPVAAVPADTPAPAPTAPAADPAAPAGEAMAGWYMQHGDMDMFQTCGQTQSLTVDSADLRARAKEFGLEPNTPVYVRVHGTIEGTTLSVVHVEQFGSDTPVNDCGLTGVVTPSEG
jgi:hypothetical protein